MSFCAPARNLMWHSRGSTELAEVPRLCNVLPAGALAEADPRRGCLGYS